MRKSRVPLLLASLFALAAGAFGLFLLLEGTEGTPVAASSPTAVPEIDRERRRGASELRGVGGDEGVLGGRESRSVLEPRAESEAPFDLATARWVEVRVILPPGTPADEEIALRAASPPEDFDLEELDTSAMNQAHLAHAVGGHGPLVSPETTGTRARMVECERTSSTSFRAPFAPDVGAGFLLLSGRYAFLREPRRVEPAAETSITLEPELGGRLRTSFLLPRVLPAGYAPEQTHAAVQLMGWGVGEEGHLATAAVGEELVADLGGLPADLNYFLQVESERFIELGEGMLRIEAGRTLEKSYQLVTGATVRGRVTDDSGVPLAGAQVGAQGSNGELMFMRNSTRSAKTGDDGRFELRALTPGGNTLSAGLEGFARGEPVELELADLQELGDVVIVLPRGNRVSGRLAWPDGRAAADGTVEVSEQVSTASEERVWRSEDKHRAATDAEGRFTVSGLGDGPFEVRAAVSIASAPRPAAEGSLVSVQHTETWHARAQRVLPGAELALVLEPPIQVLGQAVDDLGAPVKEFVVKAGEAALQGEPWRVGSDVVRDEYQSADGTFVVSRLGRGSWTIAVEAEGHGASESRTLDLPGDLGPFTFVLPRAAVVIGVVRDPLGRAAPGAAVSLRPAGRIGRWSDESEAVEADAKGAFRFESIPPGVVELSASGEECAPSEPLSVDLAPGAMVADLVLSLRVGGRLTGVVYRDDGNPDAGRQILLDQQTPGAEQETLVSDASGRFEIDHLAPGTVRVMAMPDLAGKSEADLSPEDMSTFKLASVEIRDGESTQVVLGAPPKEPVSLTGVVRSGGRPASGLMVMAMAEGGAPLSSMKFSRTLGDGTFALTLPAPGDWVLLVGDEMDDESSEFPIQVPPGESHHVELAIPGGTISGLVRGPDGTPLENVPVALSSESLVSLFGLSGGRGAVTDERGRFSFASLRAGRYSLRAGEFGRFFASEEEPDYSIAVVSGLELDEGAALTGIELSLSKPGTIRGVVRDPEGKPVVDVSVFVRAESGAVLNPMSTCLTDGKGTFRFTSAAPGSYTLSARSANGASRESASIAVSEGQETEAELVLEPGTLLVVSVEDEKGGSLRAQVSVLDEAGRDVAGLLQSDAQEKLLTEGFSSSEHRVGPLVAGSYRVVATGMDGTSAEAKVTLAGQPEHRLRLRVSY